jgi:phytanoyl-CoA hydroxylase
MKSIDKIHYEAEGYTVVEGVFDAAECEELIAHMMDLHGGRKQLEGFAPRQPEEWGRTHNQHWYDEVAQQWLVHPKLRQPLRDCLDDEPEGIQTMYFWKGSEQRRHQDQFYLPGCMSAWIALQDVDEANGTIYVQPGSHQKRLITRTDLETGGEFEDWDYNDAVDLLCERNDLPEVSVAVARGDVVLFHGVLVHHGGPIRTAGSFRHVLANHYIPYHFADWPHVQWPRLSFDGSRRISA